MLTITRYGFGQAVLGALTLVAGAGARTGGNQLGIADPPARWAPPPPSYRGTLTLARDGSNDPFDPQVIVDLDLASDRLTVRFDGFDPHRSGSGETAFISRLAAGYVADYGIVAADARGVPGAPLFVCKSFSFNLNRICHTPKLSPNGRLVAFGTAAGGGSVCKNDYGTVWADYVIVRERTGTEAARFEGYYYPEWLPDGRLLMLGSPCRGAGVWITDRSLGMPTRVDGNQVATPAKFPTVSPDGGRVAFVWNGQLWGLTLDGRHELMQLTHLDQPVSAANWSPDGTALAVLQSNVTKPVKSLLLFRPGNERGAVVRELPFYPFGPISWH
jgi:hypothetical protein